MRIELSLNSDYVPNWGVWEGLRELVSNAQDAEKEFNAPCKIEMRKSGTLLIRNEGASLPRESLLFGYSTKQNKKDMIGNFGEGMKLGVLALIRQGYTMKIKNGEEIWTPALEDSEKFNSKVLVFHTGKSKAKNIRNDLDVEIKDLGVETWDLLKECFLFIKQPEEIVQTTRGRMILDQEYQGKLYVKGIFVEYIPKFTYGYDLYFADLDRDRKMVRRFDLDWECGHIWNEATAKETAYQEQLLNKAEELLEENSHEVNYFNPKVEVSEKLATNFLDKYGDEAVPVSDISQSKEIDHLGKKGIVVSFSLRRVLEEKFGNFEDIRQQAAESKTKFLSWHELSDVDKKYFTTAKEAVEQGLEHNINNLNVVEFADPDIEGQYKDGEIFISQKILRDLPMLIHVIAHEVAHSDGDDGSPHHVQRMGHILSNALAKLVC